MRRILLICTLAAIASAGWSHPHLWIDGEIEIDLSRSGVSGVEVRWLFDEFNSADMIFSFDSDLNGSLSRAEEDRIRVEAFEHLRSADYFTIAFAGAERLAVPEATDFRATIEEGLLVYEFRLPFSLPWEAVDNTVFALFDTSYFIDFITEPASPSSRRGGRTVTLSREPLTLATEGYGTIEVAAVRLDLQ